MFDQYAGHVALKRPRCLTTEIVEYGKDDVVFNQGGVALYWYEVMEGAVRTCRFLVDGHRQLTGFFFEGDVFGTDMGQYLVSAEALTTTRLARYVNDDAVSSPAHLNRALQSAQDCIALFGHRSASERLAAFILSIARRSRGGDRVSFPISRADIADHLGLTVPTVSRTMTDFAKRKLIRAEGRAYLRILNIDALILEAAEP
jgi:CRP/FNR family transcriptional regulator, nitrogen fixation regulation protein